MSVEAPFDYLARIVEQYKQLAPQLPAEEDVLDSWMAVGFSLLGQKVLAPMGNIVEMLPVPDSTTLPGVQSWVLGLANVRGRLLPLFDLEGFFGGELSVNKKRHRVLVIEIGDLFAGLIVNEVFGMQAITEDTQMLDVPEQVGYLKPYSEGAFDKEDETWVVFEPKRLVRDPRFFNASVA